MDVIDWFFDDDRVEIIASSLPDGLEVFVAEEYVDTTTVRLEIDISYLERLQVVDSTGAVCNTQTSPIVWIYEDELGTIVCPFE